MKKTIELRVSNDYDSGFAYEMYREQLMELSKDLDISVYNTNRGMSNILPNKKIDTDGYVQSIIVKCQGYSQSEWDEYIIHYNVMTADLSMLIEDLEKLFTHKNDYIVREVEILDSGHELGLDTHVININHIEFPTKCDITREINNQCIEFDKLKFNIE